MVRLGHLRDLRLLISTQLFSKEDPSSAFLTTLGIFAVGFIGRPFGGVVFGWLGDKVGRKFSMTLCVGIAPLGSVAIGLSPTFDMMGTGASAILIVASLLQGLAHGGELPTVQVYLAEVAPAARRGFWSSLIYVSCTVGAVFGTLLGAVLSGALSDEQRHAFGWRLPFILGAVFGIVALVVRSRMEQSGVFESQASKRPPRPAPCRPPQSRASSPTSPGTGVRHCRSWA